MFKITTKYLALMTLILSTMIILSSENWFSMWMGLEINMMSFIPLISKNKDYSSSESKMIYFLIQSMGSIMLIFLMILNPMMMNTEILMNKSTSIIISLAMMMKMGVAPIHFWFVNIMNKMNWNSCFILMTWQKIAPLFVLSNMSMNNNMIMLMSMLSAMTGAIGGLNQTSIKKILAFSSINHMGWMLICLKFDNEMWMKYWMIYTLIVFMITFSMKNYSIQYINQMNLLMKNNMEKMNMIILFLSLGGLPPFIGFLPKWIVMQSLMQNNSLFVLLIIVMSSMITLFYYLRMISPIIMSYNIMNKWNTKNNNNNFINMIKIIINLMLPTTMIINMM